MDASLCSSRVVDVVRSRVDGRPTSRRSIPAAATRSFDWRITGDLTVELRAERIGAAAQRIYTIYIETLDHAGNRTVSTATVTVAHDAGSSAPAATPPTPPRHRSVGHG
jgi:hypothetical protein